MSAVTALALHASRLGSGPSGTSTHPASTPYTIARIVGTSALQNTCDLRRRAECVKSVERHDRAGALAGEVAINQRQ